MKNPGMVLVLLLAGLGTGSGHAQEERANPEVIVPVPLATIRPESGPFFRFRSRLGLGKRMEDGSSIELGLRPGVGLISLVHQITRLETECCRQQVVVGTELGVNHDWYLGSGLAAGLDVGASLIPGFRVPFYSRLYLNWFPYEGVQLKLTYDLFGG